MEQNTVSHEVILDWLTDYSYFLCDRLGVPLDQVDGLLEQYFTVKANGHPQEIAAPALEQPDTCPELPDPQLDTNVQEQSSNTFTPTEPQTLPLSQLVPIDEDDEAHVGEVEANLLPRSQSPSPPSISLLTQASPESQQLGSMSAMDLDSPGTKGPSPPSTQPPNETLFSSITSYDPRWVQHENLDPTTVENFKSNLKFEALFSQNVIKIGDILTFQVIARFNEQDENTTALLKIVASSTSGHRRGTFPDLTITLLRAPRTPFPILKSCKSTTVMVDHLRTKCHLSVLRSTWRDIRVWRAERDLGSLWWVRQAFQFWREREGRGG